MRPKTSHKRLLTTSLALFTGLVVCSAPFISLALELPKRGIPGRREPAGSRDTATLSCIAPEQDPMIALVPPSNKAITVSEYPTFFWYVPKNSAQSVDFELLDENYKPVYKTTFQVNGAPGVVSLDLPKNSGLKPLELEKNYIWYFSLNCDPKNPDNNTYYVKGWIRRVPASADLRSKVQKADPEKLPGIYATAGIWHETISTLADLRRKNPENTEFTKDWEGLLRSVDLNDYLSKPLIQCCRPGSNQAASSR